VDELKVVARKYLMNPTSFCFDFVTSLPWSYMDIYSYKVTRSQFCMKILFSKCQNCTSQMKSSGQECIDGKDVASASVSGSKRILRVIKILRILKIMRLLKGIKLVE
jgi:hypothetical protein